MIKVGIIGADVPDAGELLRLLIHHPEVDIVSLQSPSWAGRRVESRHHGFIGENIVNFSDSLDPSELNIVFIADESDSGISLLETSEDMPDLRIVDMSPERLDHLERFGMEYGLSEVNRKPLVRGARHAAIPTAAASLALISLYPLALNQQLGSDLEVTVHAPVSMAASLAKGSLAREIMSAVQRVQNDFSHNVNVRVVPVSSGRSMKVSTLLKSPLAVAEVENLFEDVYDDHSFSFTTVSHIDRNEVEGTQKCIVSLQKPGAGLLELGAVGDCHMRGGAGDAVHVMNLLFALDEKVGLSLKPSCFGDENEEGNSVSWFA